MAEEDGEEIVVRMPDCGGEGPDGYVARIRGVGERVRKDETILELDVGKVCVDVTAPEDGVITAFAVAEQAAVSTGMPLVTLRRMKLPPRRELRFGWDAGILAAWAAAWPGVERRAAEAGLLITALVRALVAVPAMVPAWPIRLVLGDVGRDDARWIHTTLSPALTVEEAVGLAAAPRPQHAETPDVLVLRGRTAQWRWGGHHEPLFVWIGSAADGGRLVEVVLVFTSEVADADVAAFAAVLAEQLALG